MKSRLTTKLLIIISFVQSPAFGNHEIDDCKQSTKKIVELSDKTKQALAHLANADYGNRPVKETYADIHSIPVSPDSTKMVGLKNLKATKQKKARKRSQDLSRGYIQNDIPQTHANIHSEPVKVSHTTKKNIQASDDTFRMHMVRSKKLKATKQKKANKRVQDLSHGYIQNNVPQTHADIHSKPVKISHTTKKNIQALDDTSRMHIYSDREAEQEAGRIGKELIKIRKQLRNTELQLDYQIGRAHV